MEGKVCSKCKRLKEKKEYNKSNARTDKMAVYCKECESVYKKKKIQERKINDLYGII